MDLVDPESEEKHKNSSIKREPTNKKPLIKQEADNNVRVKQEHGKPDAVQELHNARIKKEANQNGSRKRGYDSGGDVEMSDGEPASETLNGGASASNSATPEPMEGIQRQKAPRRKKPRPAPSFLVSHPPKKPRG